jgi:hypothetical protein
MDAIVWAFAMWYLLLGVLCAGSMCLVVSESQHTQQLVAGGLRWLLRVLALLTPLVAILICHEGRDHDPPKGRV